MNHKNTFGGKLLGLEKKTKWRPPYISAMAEDSNF